MHAYFPACIWHCRNDRLQPLDNRHRLAAAMQGFNPYFPTPQLHQYKPSYFKRIKGFQEGTNFLHKQNKSGLKSH